MKRSWLWKWIVFITTVSGFPSLFAFFFQVRCYFLVKVRCYKKHIYVQTLFFKKTVFPLLYELDLGSYDTLCGKGAYLFRWPSLSWGNIPVMALPFHSLAGFHVCAAGWMAKGRVGYPIVKPGPNCGFGKTGIIDYGVRLNRSERWDAYCYNLHGLLTTTVLYFTKQLHVTKRLFKRNGFFFQRQISLVMIIIKYKDHS